MNIDGKQLSSRIRQNLLAEVEALKSQGIHPALAVILVGEDPASVSYVTGKRKALAELGIEDKSIFLPETVSEFQLIKTIETLNKDSSVHGILVQLPLPKHIYERNVINAISPEKDVDGFTPVNLGKMFVGDSSAFVPCTPLGIVTMFKSIDIDISGSHAVVVGRSNIVGKPLSILLSNKDMNCTTTLCHTGTKNLAEITRQADILVAAVGKPHLITTDMVKTGAVVIDVGVNRISDASKKSGFKLIGDCDYDGLKDKARYITPVPGGVGPMTITMLMYNVVQAAKRH